MRSACPGPQRSKQGQPASRIVHASSLMQPTRVNEHAACARTFSFVGSGESSRSPPPRWSRGACQRASCRSTGRIAHETIMLALVASAPADVSCGGHRASSCAGCPQSRGALWCNGDCAWQGGQCSPKQSLPLCRAPACDSDWGNDGFRGYDCAAYGCRYEQRLEGHHLQVRQCNASQDCSSRSRVCAW